MSEKLLYTPEEAAQILSIGRTRLYKLLATGELSSVAIGRSRRVTRLALTIFVGSLGAIESPHTATGHRPRPLPLRGLPELERAEIRTF